MGIVCIVIFVKALKKDHFIHSRRPTRLAETRRLGLVSAGFGIGCFMLLLLPNLVTLPAYFLATIDRSIGRSVDGPGDLRRYELPCIIFFSYSIQSQDDHDAMKNTYGLTGVGWTAPAVCVVFSTFLMP